MHLQPEIVKAVKKAMIDTGNNINDKELFSRCYVDTEIAARNCNNVNNLFRYCYKPAIRSIKAIMESRVLSEVTKRTIYDRNR